jgi:transposase
VSDTKTLLPQVETIRERLGIERLVLVSDRGMISQTQIKALRDWPEVEWITALRGPSICKWVSEGKVKPEQFEKQTLFELLHPDFPDERLVVCRNPDLARHRAQKRQELLQATQKELKTVRRLVERGRLHDAQGIGVRAGKVINRYKVGKHFDLTIHDGHFHFQINTQKMDAEAALDGIYIVRTRLSESLVSAAEAVRSYKRLSQVERAFRSLKTTDLKVRPIFHRLSEQVRAHLFLCVLAYSMCSGT